MHVPYACRDAGACCSSGWAIPIETPRAVAVQTLYPAHGWLRPANGAPDDVAGVLALGADGHCVFHRGGCQIQHRLGPAAMPSACQHFPREVLIDPRGTFVTLSHYCPTAADLLFADDGPIDVVTGPPALPDCAPEGLDARHVLPPLLCDGVLMDLDGYTAWEAHMIRVLTRRDGRSPEEALQEIDADARRLQRWRPGADTLAQRIAAIGDGDGGPGGADGSAAPIRRFLAAHAFASWMAYQGDGLGAVVGALWLTLETLRAEIGARDVPLTERRLKACIRQTDLRLVHLMPRDALARAASLRFRTRR